MAKPKPKRDTSELRLVEPSSPEPKKRGGRRYSDEELGNIIERELAQALGAPGSKISQVRERNLQYYLAEPVGELAAPDLEDRSSIVATDVPDTVEGMLPSLVRVFAASPEAIECEAKRPQFIQQAKLASQYLQHWFWKRNRGFNVLYQWFKDALVQVVGFTKICVEEVTTESEDEYTGQLPEQVQALLNEPGAQITVLGKTERIVELQPGMPTTVYDLTIHRVKTERVFTVASVPPEEMRIHPRARYGDKPLFIAHVYQRTRGELEADGYNLDGVSASGTLSTTERSVRMSGQGGAWNDDSDGELETFEVSENYIQLDQNNDGVPETLFVKMIGDKVFEQKAVADHPFEWFCPNPIPHVFFGTCPADQAIEPQRLRTSLIRSVADNVYMTVHKQVGVIEGEVELDDLLNRRPGGIIRMKKADSLLPIDQQGLDQGAWGMVEWTEQWTEKRTGFTRFSQGLEADTLNNTAHGIQLATDKADARIELIARVAAESVQRLLEKTLAMMGQYQDAAAEVLIGGQFVTVDPREWRDAFNVRVNVGLGTGNKDKVAQVMGTVLQIQQPMVAAGALPMQAAILAARRFTDAAGVTGGEEFFPDASPPPPGPPMQVQIAMAQEQAKGQVAVGVKQIESQTRIQEKRAELEVQAANDARDAERSKLEAAYKFELERLKQESDARMQAMADETKRWIAQLQANTSILIEEMRQGMQREQAATAAQQSTDSTQPVMAALQDLKAHITAPRELIRDPKTGKAVGSVVRAPKPKPE